MKHLLFVLFYSLFICLACGILSPESSLTGTWRCSLFTMNGSSNAKMTLTEKNGKVNGSFIWQDLDLRISGTVNSKRQVNLETEDPIHRCIFALRTINDDFLEGSFSHYKYSEANQATMFVDGGSLELRR